MKNCCNVARKTKKCMRRSDKKEFSFPRRFSKKQCLTQKIRGFTMRSSCAPYKDCEKQRGGKISPDGIDKGIPNDNNAMEDAHGMGVMDNMDSVDLNNAFLYDNDPSVYNLSDVDSFELAGLNISDHSISDIGERTIDLDDDDMNNLSMSSELSYSDRNSFNDENNGEADSREHPLFFEAPPSPPRQRQRGGRKSRKSRKSRMNLRSKTMTYKKVSRKRKYRKTKKTRKTKRNM